MEEKKDYKQQNIQKFYFNDEGQLVVESNKGVWVDGEPYVKMYGNFSCNAKTMGEIIHQLKGIRVEIGDKNTYIVNREEHYDMRRRYDVLEEECYCVIGVNDKRLSEIIEQKAEEKAEEHNNNYTRSLERKTGEDGDKIYKLEKSIKDFNALPWYKRMFKKIEIK